MNLDKYTQKAQEALLQAQHLAEEHQHPALEPVAVILTSNSLISTRFCQNWKSGWPSPSNLSQMIIAERVMSRVPLNCNISHLINSLTSRTGCLVGNVASR